MLIRFQYKFRWPCLKPIGGMKPFFVQFVFYSQYLCWVSLLNDFACKYSHYGICPHLFLHRSSCGLHHFFFTLKHPIYSNPTNMTTQIWSGQMTQVQRKFQASCVCKSVFVAYPWNVTFSFQVAASSIAALLTSHFSLTYQFSCPNYTSVHPTCETVSPSPCCFLLTYPEA